MVDLQALLSDTKESPPCGPNLEHDLAFFELEEAARGKPEQPIGMGDSRSGEPPKLLVKPGEEPDWSRVVSLGQRLLLRSKDLRVAVTVTRGLVRTEGVPGLTAGLALIRGLLERFWDHVHPALEADQNNDPTERLNSLAPLADPDAVLKDLRDAYLVNSREHGQLRARDVEIALGRLPGTRPDGGTVKPLAQVHAQIATAFARDPSVPAALHEAGEHLLAVQTLVAERAGQAGSLDLKPLAQSVGTLIEACDTALGGRAPAASAPDGVSGVPVAAAGGPVGEIRTREDAVRMLDLVCAYFERHEPSHPAPLFIRRAQRLMQKNFVEIMKDLMPDSLSQLERLAGELENK